MEKLSTSVYECTLAVEAHMICDLLARAGISSRVDGEFLTGAGGELPLGSTIKVRVDPSQAAEARAVIDEWERLQPPESSSTPPSRPRWRSPLWFVAGMLVGGAIMLWALRTPFTTDTVDLDGDGVTDETYVYAGQVLRAIEYDRNGDLKIDARWKYDMHGVPVHLESDDDFDGRLEWQGEVERGWVARSVKDADGDGRPERVQLFTHGVLNTVEVYDARGTRVVTREHIENTRLVASEFDQDGDGVFELRVEYDRFGQPMSR
jgi:hypothetical protein